MLKVSSSFCFYFKSVSPNWSTKVCCFPLLGLCNKEVIAIFYRSVGGEYLARGVLLLILFSYLSA